MKVLAAVEYTDVFGAQGMQKENEKSWEKFKAEAVPKKQKKLGYRSSSTRQSSLPLPRG